MRVLITGAGGFVGRHLFISLLKERVVSELHLFLSSLRGFVDALPSLSKLDKTQEWRVREISADAEKRGLLFANASREVKVFLYERDLSQRNACNVPEGISICYHLASISSVKACEENSHATRAVNVDATKFLYQDSSNKGALRFVFISSGDVYGDLVEEVDESTELNPKNAYSRSKQLAELILRDSLTSDTSVCIFRPFNHYGPGQSDRFVLSRFTKRLLELKARGETTLTVGNLDAVRNFTSVYDVVSLYTKVIQSQDKEDLSIYNVASGESFRISELLEKLIEVIDHHVDCVVDPTLLRTGENRQRKRLLINCRKAQETFAWAPQISIEQGLRLLVDYWALSNF